LGFERPDESADGPTHFADSGYLRYQSVALMALLDVAPVGPDYNPGHAHADNLSFELSLFGRRLIVNSGTSLYEESDERHRQRSTRAHNTVEVDGENSSEVWKSFRVARRAYPRDLEIRESHDETVVSCAHDGYRRLRGKPMHRREWRFREGEMVVKDRVEFTGNSLFAAKAAPTHAIASFHLHPEIGVEAAGEGNVFCLTIGPDRIARFSCEGGVAEIEDTSWHPEFGLRIPNKVIRCRFEGERLTCRLRWDTH
jgi:uncharacterized heparinase superfamily protein